MYDTLLLSPGNHTNMHEKRMNSKREKDKTRKSSKLYKKLRLELKKLKSNQVSWNLGLNGQAFKYLYKYFSFLQFSIFIIRYQLVKLKKVWPMNLVLDFQVLIILMRKFLTAHLCQFPPHYHRTMIHVTTLFTSTWKQQD